VEGGTALVLEDELAFDARLGTRLQERPGTFAGREVAEADGDGVGAHDLDFLEISGAQRHVDADDSAAGPGHRHVDGEGLQRHGTHELHGQAGHGEARTGGLLGGAGREGGYGAAMLVAGIPGAAGVFGGDEVDAALGEQRHVGLVGHSRRLVAAQSAPTSARTVRRRAARPR
jgi:hypothetical protein